MGNLVWPHCAAGQEPTSRSLVSFCMRTGCTWIWKSLSPGGLASLALPGNRFSSSDRGSLASTFCSRGPGSSGLLSQETPRIKGGRDTGGRSSALGPALRPTGSPAEPCPCGCGETVPPEPWTAPRGRGLPSLTVFWSCLPSSTSAGPDWGLFRAIFPLMLAPEA